MSDRHSLKLVLVLVGLPARGKTYIGRKLRNYLSWFCSGVGGVHGGHTHIRARVFNVGEYRRTVLGGHQTSEFFDSTNKEAVALRRELCVMALRDMFEWMSVDVDEAGQMAIFDATNSTRERREMIRKECFEHCIEPIFIGMRV